MTGGTEKDMIVRSQSGMGKTATYSIAALQRLDLDEPQCQVLVLVPIWTLECNVTQVRSLCNFVDIHFFCGPMPRSSNLSF